MRRRRPFPDLPEKERAIGQRVRSARKTELLSRSTLGRAIGLTQDQLKNVELGRAALRFDPGWRLCAELDLNPLWIAFGQEPRLGFYQPLGLSEEKLGNSLFSKNLESLESGGKLGGHKYSRVREDGLKRKPYDRVAEYKSNFKTLSRCIKPADREAFWKQVENSAARFIVTAQQDHKHALRFDLDRQSHIQNKWTLKTNSRKSHWQELRRRVRDLTAKRGARADLARVLAVTPQTLNEWLQDRSAPPAEQTLRLLRWVEQSETAKIRSNRSRK